MSPPDFLFDGPADAPLTIALAHGAGAPMDSPFMQAFADGLEKEGFRVARFEFPYMAERRASGRKRPPDRAEVLLAAWRAAIAALGPENLAIGGKSLGGRMASMVADGAGVRGLVCLGYPFHPPGHARDQLPGRPAAPERLAHLAVLKTPTLICQGERDALGSRMDVESYKLSPAIRVHWLADGDHGFKPRQASGLSEAGNWRSAIAAVAAFCKELGSMRLDHVTLRTDNLEATKDFFVDALGLAVGERPAFTFPGYWLYNNERPIVHLVVASPQRSYVPGRRNDAALNDGTGAVDHIAFFGDDRDGLIRRLRRRKLEFVERTQTGTGIRQVFVAGPHGLVVEIDFAAVA